MATTEASVEELVYMSYKPFLQERRRLIAARLNEFLGTTTV